MEVTRRAFLGAGTAIGAAAAVGNVAAASATGSGTPLVEYYDDWVAAVEQVAAEDARRVSLMNEAGRNAVGRHYAGTHVQPSLAAADRACDAARARRDRIEAVIARSPARSQSDRWVKRRLVEAYPT